MWPAGRTLPRPGLRASSTFNKSFSSQKKIILYLCQRNSSSEMFSLKKNDFDYYYDNCNFNPHSKSMILKNSVANS